MIQRLWTMLAVLAVVVICTLPATVLAENKKMMNPCSATAAKKMMNPCSPNAVGTKVVNPCSATAAKKMMNPCSAAAAAEKSATDSASETDKPADAEKK